MKRMFALGVLVMALSIVNPYLSSALMPKDAIPQPLPPEDDYNCRCKNVLCTCLEDCDYEKFVCSLALPFPLNLICIPIHSSCEDRCYDTWNGEPEYECEPVETSFDRYIDCTSRCIQAGGSRIDCIADCGGI